MTTVCFVFNHAEIVGGAELGFVELIRQVKGIVRPVVIVPGEGAVSALLREASIAPVIVSFPPLRPLKAFAVIAAAFRLWIVLRKHAVDVVHTNGARCMLYAGAVSAVASVPCVWHVRVLGRDPVLDRFRAWCSRVIVVNSEATRCSIARYSGKCPLEVVYNGFDTEQFARTTALDVHREFSIPRVPVVAVVGRVSPLKRVHEVIEASGILSSRGVAHHCLIVGSSQPHESWYEEKLIGAVKGSGMTTVTFAGWRKDSFAVLKGCTVMALACTEEAFGRVVLEAWAAGTAIVAADSNGPAELVTHGKDGYLYAPGSVESLADGLQQVIENTPVRERYVEGGTGKLPSFTLEMHASRLCSLYNRLVVNKQESVAGANARLKD